MPCMSCEVKYICGGGCRIDEYHYKGIHDKIRPYEPLIKIHCDDEYKKGIYKR